MPPLAEAFVRIRPDTSTFRSEAVKGVTSAAPALGKAGDKHGKVFGTSFVKATAGPLRGIAGVIGPPVAAAFAVIGGAKLFASFIAEGREAQKTGAQTAAVLKSTGGAAHVSAAQVGDLAQSISNKVGVDDEAIQSGANLLLTFTSVRNEAGKGNDVFNRATQTITDMAAAMNNGEVTTSGLKTASIQVGKALQDPIKGITALRKVGVAFTDQQTKQIQAMVKSGNTLGAQKIILGELNKEFGGSAAAGTNAMEKLKVVFGNIQEQVGTALLPVIDKLASWLADRLPAAMAALSRVLATAKVGFDALVAAFQEGDVTSDGFVGAMERIGVAARGAFEYFKAEILPRLKEFGSFLVGTAVPALISFGGWLVKNRSWLIPLGVGILTIVAAVKTWIAVSKAFAVVQGIVNIVLAANPIGIVVLAIVGLVAALVVAYKTSDTFRHIVQAAFGAVKTAAMAVWNWLKTNWPLLLAILTGPVGLAVLAIVKHWGTIKSTAKAVWDAIKTMVTDLWTGVKTVFKEGVRIVVNTFLGLVQAVLDGAAKAFGWVPGLGGKLKKAAADFRGFRDRVNEALGGVKNRDVKVSATLQGLSASRAASEFARGGPVFGPGTATSDSIPAMLSAGEHVLTAKEVRAFGGHSAVMAMRREVVRGFAAGGPVEFNIDTQLNGMTKFKKAIADFNARVDAMARKLALAGSFSADLNGVVKFAKAMAGRPYVWGSAGPRGFDCSGFVSNLVEVAKGLPLYRRLFSTATMRNYPWSNHYGGAFEVGWFTGNPGHTGATVNGVNMESRGGDGVVVGSRSRGANYTYFNQHARLARGGPVLPGDAPFDILDPRGRHFRPGLLELLQSVRSFDTGGWLPPRSATLAVNGTNKWEPVGQGLTGPLEITGTLKIDADGNARLVAGRLAAAGNRGAR